MARRKREMLSEDELARRVAEIDVRREEVARTQGKMCRDYRALNVEKARLFYGRGKAQPEPVQKVTGERAEFRFRALIASGEAYEQLERAQAYMRRHGMKALEEIASGKERSEAKCPKCSYNFTVEVQTDPRVRLAALKEISEFAQVIAQATIAMAKTLRNDDESDEKTVELEWPTEGVKG